MTSASQLFKRLNSYTRQHPLYRALKEYGKLEKSIFPLKWIDLLDFRQAVEKQLNKGEQANRFADAVSFSRNQEFLYAKKTEQEVAEGCNRLIRNAIICWNYLYLSQLLAQETEEERRQALLTAGKEGSIVIWHHLNLHGEYDFSEAKVQDSVDSSCPKYWRLTSRKKKRILATGLQEATYGESYDGLCTFVGFYPDSMDDCPYGAR